MAAHVLTFGVVIYLVVERFAEVRWKFPETKKKVTTTIKPKYSVSADGYIHRRRTVYEKNVRSFTVDFA